MARLPSTRCWVGCGLVGLLAGLGIGAVDAVDEPEDELKAATVLTFLRHSEWLRGATSGPITLGVMGRPSTIRILRQTLDGKAANNRVVRIVEAKASLELYSCQVLYVASDNNREVRQALADLRASPALIIGEADRFLEYGGAVRLLIVDGHMSFEVNAAALDRVGVSISSKLLRYGQVKVRSPE